jgi:hypothetical protein
MAFYTQCDQIFFKVTARVASEFDVVYLETLHAAATLAAPAVALEHSLMQLVVAF